MVGLLMLIGIVVTNAIVLIDLINQYRAKGEDLEDRHRRRRPAASPADHHDRDGDDLRADPDGLGLTGGGAFISQPLAIVVIGGLVSSTS